MPTEFWSGCSLMYQQAIAPAMAITAPTDRSMPPVAMTSVMPSATRISGVPKMRMEMRLPYRCPLRMLTAKKFGVNGRLNSSRTTRMAAGQNRWCRVSPRQFRAVMGVLHSRWSA